MNRDFSETYYRKRFRKPQNYEMECKKKKDEIVPAVPLMMLQPSYNISCPIILNSAEMNIDAGSFYEIAHVHLPIRTPVNLRSVRVALVSEKTDITVSIKYPSKGSLGKYFTSNSGEVDAYPELDGTFVMGIGLAARVLLRKVPFQEFADKKHLHEFWLLGDDGSRKGFGGLSDELTGNGMLRWGTRRRVRFLGKHNEPTTTLTTTDHSSSSLEVAKVKVDDEKEVESMEEDEEGDENEDEDEEANENEDENEETEDEGEKEGEEDQDVGGAVKEEEEIEEETEGEEEVEVKEESKKGVKRKRYNFRASVRKTTKKVIKVEKPKLKKPKIAPRKQNKCRQLMVLKNPKDRWSEERYKFAEKSLWEVMKAKGALANNPILRPDLRIEARKKIGDTGLLDHLLKHMAGKVAPCGKDRFRRRHNAEGQMEYWLESADLVDIRNEAGVKDPYWIPPPGWELGDSITQDPIFAKELKHLKEEILEVKRHAKKKQVQLEEEIKNLRSEIKELKSKKKKGDSQAIVIASNPVGDNKELNQLANSSSVNIAILDLNKAPEQDKCKEQQINISDFVKELQEKFKKLESKVEERNKSNLALMVPTESFHLKDERQGQRVAAAEGGGTEFKIDNHQEVKAKAPAETEKPKSGLTGEGSEKAAKIERLRSGFRICKPQGTFLWPNMMSPTTSSPSQQSLVQMEDLLLVPTPPSISLTPPRLPYQHHHQAPQLVKPLAERRRGFAVTASTEDTTIITSSLMAHHFMGSANEGETY